MSKIKPGKKYEWLHLPSETTLEDLQNAKFIWENSIEGEIRVISNNNTIYSIFLFSNSPELNGSCPYMDDDGIGITKDPNFKFSWTMGSFDTIDGKVAKQLRENDEDGDGRVIKVIFDAKKITIPKSMLTAIFDEQKK